MGFRPPSTIFESDTLCLKDNIVFILFWGICLCFVGIEKWNRGCPCLVKTLKSTKTNYFTFINLSVILSLLESTFYRMFCHLYYDFDTLLDLFYDVFLFHPNKSHHPTLPQKCRKLRRVSRRDIRRRRRRATPGPMSCVGVRPKGQGVGWGSDTVVAA